MSRSSGWASNAAEKTPSMTKEIRKERRKIVNDLCLTLFPHYESKKKDHGSIKQFIDDKNSYATSSRRMLHAMVSVA